MGEMKRVEGLGGWKQSSAISPPRAEKKPGALTCPPGSFTLSRGALHGGQSPERSNLSWARSWLVVGTLSLLWRR